MWNVVCVCSKIRLVTYTFLNLVSALISSRKILILREWRGEIYRRNAHFYFVLGLMTLWIYNSTWSQIWEWRKSNELKRIFKSFGKSASVGKKVTHVSKVRNVRNFLPKDSITAHKIRVFSKYTVRTSNEAITKNVIQKSNCVVTCTVPTLACMDAAKPQGSSVSVAGV
jgi:hypothetical protein